MKLPTSSIILGTLILATIVVAYVGDLVGKNVGKRRLSVFGLRPRHTGILISVLTGVLILGMAVVTMALSSRRVSDALFRMDSLRQKEQELRAHNRVLHAESERLRQRQAELKKQAAELETEVTRLTAAVEETRSRLTTTRKLLAKAEQELAARRKELRRVRAQLTEVRKQLANSEKQLDEGERIVFDQGRKLLATEERVNKLQDQEKRLRTRLGGLEDDVKQLTEFRDQLLGIARRAREGNVIYEANQLIARAVIQSDQSEDAIRAQLVSLLKRASREAEQKGARPEKKGQRAVRIATRRGGAPEHPIYYHEEEILDLLAKDIRAAGGSVVVEVWALRNYVAGEQIGADFVLFPNRLVFTAGQVLLDRKLDPTQPKAALFREILAALHDLRQLARKSGMRRNAAGQYGEVSYEQIFSLLDRITGKKKPVHFQIVAAADAWTAGPLQVRFQLAEAGGS